MPSSPSSPPRVLVIDDDVDIREAVQTALEEAGYAVIAAADGAEGLMRVERDCPDIVVLDVVMPRRSGLRVLEVLNQRTHDGPSVILMTGNTGDALKQFAKEHGADVYLSKPFDIDELLTEVRRLLPLPE